MSGDFDVVGIDHFQLAMPAGREAEARAFYTGLLGIPERPKPEALRARGGAWFEAPGVKLHLGVEERFQPARKAHPGLVVRDLEALVARLRAAGHEVSEDDRTGAPRAFVHDPFGNRIELLTLP